MADTDGEFRKKLIGQYKKIKVDLAKVYEGMEEMQRLLESNPTAAEGTKALFKAWTDIWGKRYPGTPYLFEYAKHGAAFKRFLKTMTQADIMERMNRFVQKNDRFYVASKHSVNVFIATVNEHGPEALERGSIPAPIGCQHVPPCETDQAHTSRRMSEMRGDGQPARASDTAF